MRARQSATAGPLVGVLSLLVLAPAETFGQYAPGEQGSDNVKIVAHVPLAGALQVADIEIEQDPGAPLRVFIAAAQPVRVPNHRPVGARRGEGHLLVVH